MVSKIKRLVVFFVLCAIGLGAFQNCSKTNFTAVEESKIGSLEYPVDPKTGFAPIPVDGNSNSSESAIKIFLVIDTSFSMVNELNKVKVALSAFIDEQRTRQAFDIYLYPIYDFNELINSEAGGDSVEYTLRPPLAEMKLRNDSNFANAKSVFMSKFQEQINKITINDINETGMCQVARIIKEKKFYNSQDSVAVIVVTDEDDSSLDEGYCIGSATKIKIDSSIQLEADYVGTLADGHWSGLVKADGGGTAPFTKDYFAIAPNCGQYGIPCVAGVYNCAPEHIDYLMHIPYYGTNYGQLHSVTSVDDCQVRVTNGRIGFGGMYVKDMKTLSGQTLKQSDIDKILAGTQGFMYNGKSYTNTSNYALMEFPQYSKNVTAQFYEERYKHENHQMPEFHNKTAAQSNKAVMDIIKKQLPDASKVAMDFVIYNPTLNPAGVTCGLQDTGTIGKRYQDFVKQAGLPELYKAESICQSVYTSSLLHAAKLTAEWSAVREYVLVGANASQINLIRGVQIVDAQGNLIKVLKGNEYSVNVDKKILTIADSIELPQGMTIVLLP